MSRLSSGGIGIRFLFALLLVLASYNPSGYSYFHWVKSILPEFSSITPYIAIAGIALVIGWVIYIRATLRSLGLIGINLVGATSACIIWLLFYWGILNFEPNGKKAFEWVILFMISVGLTVGMCWSHIRRMLSGQVDADDISSHID